MRLTFGRHHSGTKIAEEETGSNPHGSAAAEGDPQASRAWSGPQQSYSRGAGLLEGKLRNRNNFIINNLDVHSDTQSENQQLHKIPVENSTKRGINQCKKKEKHPKPEHLYSYKGSQLLNSRGTKLDGE